MYEIGGDFFIHVLSVKTQNHSFSHKHVIFMDIFYTWTTKAKKEQQTIACFKGTSACTTKNLTKYLCLVSSLNTLQKLDLI